MSTIIKHVHLADAPEELAWILHSASPLFRKSFTAKLPPPLRWHLPKASAATMGRARAGAVGWGGAHGLTRELAWQGVAPLTPLRASDCTVGAPLRVARQPHHLHLRQDDAAAAAGGAAPGWLLLLLIAVSDRATKVGASVCTSILCRAFSETHWYLT